MTAPGGKTRPKAFLRFFGSVRLGVSLIILITVAAAVGTFIPQNPPPGAIEATFGGLAPVIHRLQMTRLYQAPWFLALLFLFALNLLACTLPRSRAVLRRVFRPRAEADARRMAGFRLREGFSSGTSLEAALAAIRRKLLAGGWKLHEAYGGDDAVLTAAKMSAGRLGSSFVHLGLLVILAGGLTTGLGGFRERLVLSIGETAAVTGRDMEIRLDDFTTEYHPEGGVKAWKSRVTVLENGAPAAAAVIEVNHPLTRRGVSFYQESYGWDWRSADLEILVGRAGRPERERLVLQEGGAAVLEDGTSVGVRYVVPDFFINERNEIGTRSYEPRNPAVLVEGKTETGAVFQAWLFSLHPEFNRIRGPEDPDIVLEFADVSVSQYSVLGAARDPGSPFIWFGSALVMAGLVLVFYFRPREMLVHLVRKDGETEIRAGGSAARGQEHFEKEFAEIMAAIRREL